MPFALSVEQSFSGSLPSRRSNSGMPSPSSTGTSVNHYRSIRSRSISCRTMEAPPQIQMSPPGCARSASISSGSGRSVKQIRSPEGRCSCVST